MTMVEGWFNEDHSKFVWCVNGCLYMEVSRAEAVEVNQFDYQKLIATRFAPLAFLAMPVHDNPM